MPIAELSELAANIAVAAMTAIPVAAVLILTIILISRRTDPPGQNSDTPWIDADWTPSTKHRFNFRDFISRKLPEVRCDQCPCSWEEWSFEGDGDCGCVLHKNDDMPEYGFLCRLPNIVKRFLRRRIDNHMDKLRAHEYDGLAEWFEKEQAKDSAMLDILMTKFPHMSFDIAIATEVRIDYEEKIKNLDKEASKTA